MATLEQDGSFKDCDPRKKVDLKNIWPEKERTLEKNPFYHVVLLLLKSTTNEKYIAYRHKTGMETILFTFLLLSVIVVLVYEFTIVRFLSNTVNSRQLLRIPRYCGQQLKSRKLRNYWKQLPLLRTFSITDIKSWPDSVRYNKSWM